MKRSSQPERDADIRGIWRIISTRRGSNSPPGKLGIWLFLTTEILLFSGLFCAYAVFRSNHPEVFQYAHLYLSRTLGATNTLVLIFSSFTMASAVRAAQVGDRKWLVRLLAVTLVCGCVFLGIKFVEYKAKWEEGLLTGGSYRPTAPPEGADVPEAGKLKTPKPPAADLDDAQPLTGSMEPVQSKIAPAPIGPSGIAPQWLAGDHAHAADAWVGPEPYNVQMFFGIYFAMTGLHGVHVLAGMGLIAWILVARGAATSARTTSIPSISPASTGIWSIWSGYSYSPCSI